MKKEKKKEKKGKDKKVKKLVIIEADPGAGYHQFDTDKGLVIHKPKNKKETCSICSHYYKGRFCRKEGPTLHLAIMHRFLNIGFTKAQASNRSYYLPEIPASWHCKNWREKE